MVECNEVSVCLYVSVCQPVRFGRFFLALENIILKMEKSLRFYE